jgi:hypothetical protein
MTPQLQHKPNSVASLECPVPQNMGCRQLGSVYYIHFKVLVSVATLNSNTGGIKYTF